MKEDLSTVFKRRGHMKAHRATWRRSTRMAQEAQCEGKNSPESIVDFRGKQRQGMVELFSVGKFESLGQALGHNFGSLQ